MRTSTTVDLRAVRDELAFRESLPAPVANVLFDGEPRCDYERAKRLVAAGDIGAAHAPLSRVASGGGDPRTRFFADRRLKLAAPVASPPTSCTVRGSSPGLAQPSLFGPVPVLGKLAVYGPDNELSRIVRQFKKDPAEAIPEYMSCRTEIAGRLGYALRGMLGGSGLLEADVVIPVPPDPARYAARGYAFPVDLARAIAHHALVPCLDSLVYKLRSTRDLRTFADGEARRNELRGSMGVDERRVHLVAGSCIVVADDVVTYGTHFAEIKRLLLASGARCVHGIALTAARGAIGPIGRLEHGTQSCFERKAGF